MKSYPQRTPQQLADIIESACFEFNKTIPNSGRKDKRRFNKEIDGLIKQLARKHMLKYKTLLNILMHENLDTKRCERNTTKRYSVASWKD